MIGKLQSISGWGGVPSARTRLFEASSAETVEAVLSGRANHPRGIIPRGLGRSYGDAAQRSGGATLIITSDDGPVWLDRSSRIVRSPAGTSIGDLIRFVDAAGYFVPVTPGTRYVTVGGTIAADVHGKDHHAASSFGAHIVSFRLMLASGEAVEVDRDSDRDLFNATIGGMGLTGVILNADIRMLEVPGNQILVDTFRTVDLDATMTALTDSEASHRYSVAWVDLSAEGSTMGRGVVTNGNHTSADGHNSLHDPFLTVPHIPTSSLVNKFSVRAFNELWFRKAPSVLRQDVQTYDKFFYPLDVVRNWNRIYGRRGFLQYQFVLPLGSEDLLPTLVTSLAASAVPVSLAVLKRFGEESGGYLSFPMPGWTLAADIPIPGSPFELEERLRRIDERLAEVGGRVYLAKDSRLRGDMMPKMYPRLDLFMKTRDRVDPDRLFQSDLSARLGL